MSQNFRYPPPGFGQNRPNPNFPVNQQFQNSTGPSRFRSSFNSSHSDYRYDTRHRWPPNPNRFTPPYEPRNQYASRYSVPPPFNPSRPPPRLPYRPSEQSFRPIYRAPRDMPPRNRHPIKSNYRRERDTDAPLTERDQLLVKWRSNYCETSDDIARKLAEMDPNENKDMWIRSSPADIFYKRCENGDVESTNRLDALCTLFDQELVTRGLQIREKQPPYTSPPRKRKHKVCRHKCKLSVISSIYHFTDPIIAIIFSGEMLIF